MCNRRQLVDGVSHRASHLYKNFFGLYRLIWSVVTHLFYSENLMIKQNSFSFLKTSTGCLEASICRWKRLTQSSLADFWAVSVTFTAGKADPRFVLDFYIFSSITVGVAPTRLKSITRNLNNLIKYFGRVVSRHSTKCLQTFSILILFFCRL